MTLSSRHLQDDRLFDSYFADRHGSPIDPAVADHLTVCAACGGRYAELAQFLDSLRDTAVAEADAIFTPDRLQAQQRQIARRIESRRARGPRPQVPPSVQHPDDHGLELAHGPALGRRRRGGRVVRRCRPRRFVQGGLARWGHGEAAWRRADAPSITRTRR